MEIEFITPKKAKEYLLKNDPDNCPINMNKVLELKEKMENGKWELRDSIGFSYFTNELLNGQYRMKALSMSNIKGLHFNIIRG